MLIAIPLAKTRAQTRNYLIPGIFMVVTTLAALLWETWTFINAGIQYLFFGNNGPLTLQMTKKPVSDIPWAALGIDIIFIVVGVVLFAVGLSMSVRLFRSYSASRAEARARAPAAADGGEVEK